MSTSKQAWGCSAIVLVALFAIAWLIYDDQRHMVSNGLSKALSFDTRRNYEEALDASPLIERMVCSDLTRDGVRTCSVTLSTSNAPYYVDRALTGAPQRVTASMSLSVLDKGGLPNRFEYRLDVDAEYSKRVVDYHTGELRPSETVTDFEGYTVAVRVRGVEGDPAERPMTSLLEPLKGSLHNVSEAAMASATARTFHQDIARAIEVNSNRLSYRR